MVPATTICDSACLAGPMSIRELRANMGQRMERSP